MVSMRRTLPLLGLRDFEAAARGGSFAAAAMELGVTPGAVSQQVRSLEDRIGVRLFERRPQSLVLTEAAKALLPTLSSALDTIEAALTRLSSPRPRSTLTLAMPAPFAMGWFLPRQRNFHARYRRIEIVPRSSSRLLQPGIEGVDAAFSHGRAGWRDLDCAFLFNDALVPLCNPQYLEGRSNPGPGSGDLAGHTVLASETAPDLWSKWQNATTKGRPPESIMTFGDDGLVMQAALNGLGIALLDRHLADGPLREGRLVAPFDVPAWERGTAWYLVFEEARRHEESMTALLDWLLDEIAGPMP
ncbi:MAG: LysR substrate-binding domain-containing protein [Stellaceae bacterium]